MKAVRHYVLTKVVMKSAMSYKIMTWGKEESPGIPFGQLIEIQASEAPFVSMGTNYRGDPPLYIPGVIPLRCLSQEGVNLRNSIGNMWFYIHETALH